MTTYWPTLDVFAELGQCCTKALAASVTRAALERARAEREASLSGFEQRQKAAVRMGTTKAGEGCPETVKEVPRLVFDFIQRRSDEKVASYTLREGSAFFCSIRSISTIRSICGLSAPPESGLFAQHLGPMIQPCRFGITGPLIESIHIGFIHQGPDCTNQTKQVGNSHTAFCSRRISVPLILPVLLARTSLASKELHHHLQRSKPLQSKTSLVDVIYWG